MKKKILIVTRSLASSGGVESALINMLKQINNDYTIDLYCFYMDKRFRRLIPKNINIIEPNYFIQVLGMSQKQSKKQSKLLYSIRSICALLSKKISNRIIIENILRLQNKLIGYDVAISYIQDANKYSLYSGTNKFVLFRVEAKKKIAFIHGDYQKSGLNTIENYRIYSKYDKLIAVSQGCMKNVIQAIPEFKDKLTYIYNFKDIDEILDKANQENIKFNDEKVNIVTVCRLSEEKGLLRTIEIINRLIKEGYKICWHIIGEGIERIKLENYINKFKLNEFIVLYGEKSNPYPYIKAADFFLLPSIHEAAPMVIDEAKIIGTPVLSTRNPSSDEQIKANKEGIILDNTKNGIYEGIKEVLDNENIIKDIKNNYERDKLYENNTAKKQFIYMIENL